MSFLHNQSPECISSALQLWGVTPTDEACREGNYIEFSTRASTEDATVFDYDIPANSDDYYDLPRTLHYVKLKIVAENGADTAEGDDVAPINNLGHSLWSQLDITANNKLITQSSQTYAYRAYLQNLLSYDRGAKTTHLTAGLYYQDTAGQFNTLGAANEGYVNRKRLTAKSKVIELLNPIHADLFSQDRYLLSGVPLHLRFTRNKDSFVLMSSKKERIKILDSRLIMRKVKLSPDLLVAHAKALAVAPAKYPVTRVDMRTYTIPAGLQSKTIDYLNSSNIANRLVAVFVSNRAFNGDYALNGLEFLNCKINHFSLHADSQQIPCRPFTPNFETGEYMREYYSLFNGTGIHFSDAGMMIDREAYGKGFTIFAIDLTPGLTAGHDHWGLERQGNMRLEVRFAEPLAEPINCIVMSEYDNLIQIDRQRSVIVDYAT